MQAARRQGVIAAAYTAVAIVTRSFMTLARIGVGTRGVARVILGIIGGVSGLITLLAGLAFLVIAAILAVVVPGMIALELVFFLLFGENGSTLANSLLLTPLAVIVWGWVWWLSGHDIRQQRKDLRYGVRAENYARDNNLEYTRVRHPDRHLRGMLFQVGRPVVTEHRVRRTGRPSAEIARYTFDLSGDPNSPTLVTWGYATLRLPAALPHIVLDARGANNLLSTSLPGMWAPRTEQKLSLEGDFDRYFTLFCPRGYEADALYLFTPDVMTRLIDRAALYDVEIIDNQLFLYSKRHLARDDAASWQRADGALRAMAEKVEQWGRWRDDRRPHPAHPLQSAPAGPAEEGRRLTRSFPIGAAILAAGFVAIAGAIVWNDIAELFADTRQLFSWIGSLFR